MYVISFANSMDYIKLYNFCLLFCVKKFRVLQSVLLVMEELRNLMNSAKLQMIFRAPKNTRKQKL